MKRLVIALTLGACAASATGSSFAQPVPQRQAHQEQRIAQGVASGAITRGEDRRLQARERSIARQEHRMRGRDAGRLTPHDRRVLEARENRTSRAIYRDKHNARVG